MLGVLFVLSLVLSACVTVPRNVTAPGATPSATTDAVPTASTGAVPSSPAVPASPATEATSTNDPTPMGTTTPETAPPDATFAQEATPLAAIATEPTDAPRSTELSIGYISLDESQAFVQAVSLGSASRLPMQGSNSSSATLAGRETASRPVPPLWPERASTGSSASSPSATS